MYEVEALEDALETIRDLFAVQREELASLKRAPLTPAQEAAIQRQEIRISQLLNERAATQKELSQYKEEVARLVLLLQRERI